MSRFFDLVIYASTILTAIVTITGFIVKWLDKRLKIILEPIKIQIHKMDVKECRRFLIDFLADVENRIQKNQIQWKFAHDVYDHYVNELKENSYVKDRWERVVNYENNE